MEEKTIMKNIHLVIKYLIVAFVGIILILVSKEPPMSSLFYILLFIVTMIIAREDLSEKAFKAYLLVPVGVISLLRFACYFDENWYLQVIMTLIVLLGFLLIKKLSKGGVGTGDIIYLTLFALGFGIHNLLYTLLFSSLVVAVVGTVLLISKKLNKKDALPFMPFILLGIVMNVLI